MNRYTLLIHVPQCGLWHKIGEFSTISDAIKRAKMGTSEFRIKHPKWNVNTNRYEDAVVYDSLIGYTC